MAVDQKVTQRQYTRYRFSGPITLSQVSSDRRAAITGMTVEISRGGLSAIFEDGLSVADTVSLKFEVIVARRLVRRLELRAVVRNKLRSRYGFEFLHLSTTERETIEMACAGLPVYVGPD